MTRHVTAILFGPAALWGMVATAGLAMTWADADAWGPTDRRAATAVGSDTCRRCHPDEHASWHDSYHRTMTQPAEAALAPFAGETLDYLGFRATMTRNAAGTPHVTMQRLTDDGRAGDVVLDVDVELCVGSHRYQQYVARFDRPGDRHARWRLPVAWHRGARRWIPMGAAFLTPDGREGDLDDALRHVTPYDDNCLFCHNTEPAPGLRPDGSFRPTVAELGIACEACHGPASAHVARHAGPMRRVLAGIVDAADAPEGSIAHPGKLDAGRQVDVCGRCHGQRIGRDIDRILRHGDGFLPGEVLAEVSRPILRDAVVGDGPAGQFEVRFWPDGTPRLSAYEYQAHLQTPCFDDGEGLACGDCHTMHGDEPDMQLRADYDEARVCARCHEPAELSAARARGGHGGHVGIADVDCADCHRPRITYGLVQGMRTHRISIPDPATAVGRADTPDACTQCHVDRDAAWAAAALAGDEVVASGPSRIAADLLGGDPIQRALAIDALAQPGATLDAQTRAAWLADALADDYPALRLMAWMALGAVAGDDDALAALVAAYDPLADPAAREPVAAALAERLGPGPLTADPIREMLIAGRFDREIWIGE